MTLKTKTISKNEEDLKNKNELKNEYKLKKEDIQKWRHKKMKTSKNENKLKKEDIQKWMQTQKGRQLKINWDKLKI